jgi:hypothetical protein
MTRGAMMTTGNMFIKGYPEHWRARAGLASSRNGATLLCRGVHFSWASAGQQQSWITQHYARLGSLQRQPASRRYRFISRYAVFDHQETLSSANTQSRLHDYLHPIEAQAHHPIRITCRRLLMPTLRNNSERRPKHLQTSSAVSTHPYVGRLLITRSRFYQH